MNPRKELLWSLWEVVGPKHPNRKPSTSTPNTPDDDKEPSEVESTHYLAYESFNFIPKLSVAVLRMSTSEARNPKNGLHSPKEFRFWLKLPAWDPRKQQGRHTWLMHEAGDRSIE